MCKLVKSLYGLKQAPKQWHENFDQVILSYDFYVKNSDKCVYVKQCDNGVYAILCLYVDYILIFGSNIDIINDVKHMLSSKFDMKDLGPIDVILGIKILTKDGDIILTQYHCVENLLKKFNY